MTLAPSDGGLEVRTSTFDPIHDLEQAYAERLALLSASRSDRKALSANAIRIQRLEAEVQAGRGTAHAMPLAHTIPPARPALDRRVRDRRAIDSSDWLG